MQRTVTEKQAIAEKLKAILDKYAPRHWLINATYPWDHPANKVPDCVALTLDGFPYWKFSFVGRSLRMAAKIDVPDARAIGIPNGRFVSLAQIDAGIRKALRPTNQQMSPNVRGKI